MNSFKIQILTDLEQSIELLNLCEFSQNDKLSLLYRGTLDGFTGRDFHSKCNNRRPNRRRLSLGVLHRSIGTVQ